MSAKIFLSSSVKYVAQMDMNIQYTENGGIEASQTFLARKSSLGTSDLNLFKRGTTWEALFPEVPTAYRFLTMKTFDPSDHQSGIISIKATFTGYQYAGNGSSGEEAEVPTTSLRPNEEIKSIIHHKKWDALTAIQKKRLNWLMSGYVVFNPDSEKWGAISEDTGAFSDFDTGAWPSPTGDELEFAKMIAESETTFRGPSWNYTYRTESKTGFTGAQLNKAFKIVANPPGTPAKPSGDWTWLLIAPDQTQSGPDRFVKELTFQLIEDNDRNQFLYGE